MKIVHLVNSDPVNHSELNGINNVVFNLATTQSKYGRVDICGITHLETSRQVVNSNLTFHNVKRNLLRTSLIKYMNQNRSLFFEKEVVYHFHNVYVFEYFLLAIILKRKNYKWVVTPHNGFNPLRFNRKEMLNFIAKKLYFNLFESFIVNNAFKIHACGPKEEIDLINFLPKKTVKYVPNGVCSNNYSISVNEYQHGIIDIGYLGRIEIKPKGLDILVKSMNTIYQKRKNIRLQIIGSGFDETKLKDLVKELKLENAISFVGPKYGEEKLKTLSKLNFYIQLSRFEGFPITILEAASVGLPLITSVGCGIKNLISRYENGIVIQTSSINSIAQTIVEFIDSLSITEYRKMSQNSLNMVNENFTWDKITPKFLTELYN